MAYLKSVETDVLPLPSDPQFTITMKRKASYGDVTAAQGAMLKVKDLGAGLSDIEWASYVRTMAAALILEWNLTDENEQPLAVTPANIDRLDPADGQFIANEAVKRAQVRTGDEQANFPVTSGSR